MAGYRWNDGEAAKVRALVREGLTDTEIAVKLKDVLAGRHSRLGIRKYAGKVRSGVAVQPVGMPEMLPDIPMRDVFEYLKGETQRTMREICNKFDRSPETIREWLDEMEATGYSLVEGKQGVSIPVKSRRQVPTPARTLADEAGMVISVGVISDTHNGGAHAQPSAVAKCAEIMANEYGVRHIVRPGDLTSGIFGYRGQLYDLVPAARPISRSMAHLATEAQVQIADTCTPKIDGVEWFELGGNHDWWHVVNAGLDPVKMFCDRREDAHYLGYDVNGLWLTDKVYLRLWHPSGGVPYAKSYRLQKGMETQSSEALKKANTSALEINRILVEQAGKHKGDMKAAMQMIGELKTAVSSVLIAGHLHIAVWMSEPPMMGLHPGCFEGKTNYLKRKGLDPSIGGVVLRFLVTDGGLVQRVEHTWIGFDEVENDWKNWPMPEAEVSLDEAEEMEALYRFDASPAGEFVIEDPRKGLGPSGHEYVGGK